MLHPHFLISMPEGSEWLLILLVFPIYLLPTILAASRKNPSTGGIFVLNLFLGWTFLGWIGALIWAFSTKRSQSPTIIVNNTSQPYSQEYKGGQTNANMQTPPEEKHATPITHQDKIDHLRQLKQLLDEGILTTEEFNNQKAAILA